MPDLLSSLNPQQQEVVRATHGPVLVLAGAGSGKTRALTHRIAYLLDQHLAHPQEILAVTFTNKAAHEMKERVAHLTGQAHHLPRAIGTFHSIGARLLREHAPYGKRSVRFTIFDSGDSERLVRQVMRELQLSTREWNPASIRARISQAKNQRRSPTDIATASQSPADEVLARVFARYEALLEQNDAYDFDDLLLLPVQRLEQDSAMRQHYQQLWRFISVDEYQDTNPLQEQLLHLLLGPEKNLCVVGDDYQAIYSWRGARVDHILRFETQYPNCTTIYLTQNYRSSPSILESANQIIAANTTQKHKQLWTARTQSEPVEFVQLPSDQHEARWIRTLLVQHRQAGGALRDWAILYRTNAQSRPLEEEFLTHGVPYTIIGGFRFYERREVKDALALLQLWANPNLGIALRRIAEALWRGVGPKTLQRWEELAQQTGTSFEALLAREAGTKPAIKNTLTAFQTAREQTFSNVAELLRHLLEKSGYLAYLRQQPDGPERLENIDELLNVTATHTEVDAFLQEVALLSDIDTHEASADRVTCLTLHSSKGLEFNRVIVIGCEEGLLPHINSFDSVANIEEERRLLYVGMTRAKEKLILTAAATRFTHGEFSNQLPSRFLETLPAHVRSGPAPEETELIAEVGDEPVVTRGMIVHHRQFGRGVILEGRGSLVTAIFEGHGLKTVDARSISM